MARYALVFTALIALSSVASLAAAIPQRKSLVLRDLINECAPFDVGPEERCGYVLSNCKSLAGMFDFLQLTFCSLQSFISNSISAMAVSLAIQSAWFCLCFVVMLIVCDRFFVPSVERLSDFLKLSPAVAGVTLISLGSAGPDVFTQMSMAASASSAGQGIELALSEPMGNGLFITTCVIGLIVVFSPTPIIQLNRSLFLKDCLFYLGGLVGVFLMLQEGKIYQWQLALAAGWYLLYIVVSIVLSRALHQEPLHAEPGRHEVPLPPYRTTSYRLDRISEASSMIGAGDTAFTPLLEGMEEEEEEEEEEEVNGDLEEGWGSEDDFHSAREANSVMGSSSAASSASPYKVRVRIENSEHMPPSPRSRRGERVNPLGSVAEGESGRFYDAESQRGTSFVPSLALSSTGSVEVGEIEGSALPHDELSLFSFPLLLPPEAGPSKDPIVNEEENQRSINDEILPLEDSLAESSPSPFAPRLPSPPPVPPLPLHKLPQPSEYYHELFPNPSSSTHPHHHHPGHQSHTKKKRRTVWRLIRGPIQGLLSLTLPLVSNRKGSGALYPKTCAVLLPFALPILFATHVWPEWLSGPKVPGEGPEGWIVDHPWQASLLLAACATASLAALIFYPRDGRLVEGHGFILGVFTVIAFLGSVVWMEAIAGEIVATTASLGICIDVPSTLLAVTLLSWGNSSSDLAANLSLSADGFPTAALAACFGSPLMVLLGGLFFSLLGTTSGIRRDSTSSGEDVPIWPIELPDDPDLCFLMALGAICVLVMMITVSLSQFRLSKSTAVVAFAAYGLSICFYSYSKLSKH